MNEHASCAPLKPQETDWCSVITHLQSLWGHTPALLWNSQKILEVSELKLKIGALTV